MNADILAEGIAGGWLRAPLGESLQGATPAVAARLGHIRHALFDFDGTLSVLREGWEGVMVPLMVEMICDGGQATPEIEQEVREYVDRSTGILTIEQMEWLVEAVRRHGLASHPLDAYEYKAIYLDRLMGSVRERLARLQSGQVLPSEMMVAGAGEFVARLAGQGVTLYLASGSDHAGVVDEAEALGIARFFSGGIYGALDHSVANAKSRIIAHIIEDHGLHGDELLVAGDGPVEIRHGVACGAITLGVASDEIRRAGWNTRKIERLSTAGAGLLIADFQEHRALVSLLCCANMA